VQSHPGPLQTLEGASELSPVTHYCPACRSSQETKRYQRKSNVAARQASSQNHQSIIVVTIEEIGGGEELVGATLSQLISLDPRDRKWRARMRRGGAQLHKNRKSSSHQRQRRSWDSLNRACLLCFASRSRGLVNLSCLCYFFGVWVRWCCRRRCWRGDQGGDKEGELRGPFQLQPASAFSLC